MLRGCVVARMIRKADLPRKTCAACGREMVWRRRWADVWDEVRYCSARCQREAKRHRAAKSNDD